ncbi:hypothetical protein GLAREA_05260 [Glarea lozoyensis ATCC 20868]|uniref:Uncharacterized protein n=1 Tax=Glarea lozoyensis (strain ATCC 20868 / MF5171) TaxID=1116229 RepID=S3DBW8_GLAL2|nr:uncharacterized protein GLAREA_05260 [Glarea lozoyensis ATCC 20868]EPE35922.1 hypothetical protein GLAREA_05260 [Glarea lozoyensis ATCC 20868]
MSVRVLELDRLKITDSEHEDEIEWFVRPSIHVKIPETIFHKQDSEIVEALKSGDIWASRGAYCSLDCYIETGRLLDSEQKLRLCESLGYLIRDSHLWAQLSLPVSLIIARPLDLAASQPDFSLRLANQLPKPAPISQTDSWLSGTIDVNPPTSVVCSTIQKIDICLEMSIAQHKLDNPPKRVKAAVKSLIEEDACTTKTVPRIEIFEGIVRRLSCSLSESITKCFGYPGSNQTEDSSIPSGGQVKQLNKQDCQDVPAELEEMLLNSLSTDAVAAGVVGQTDEEMLLSHCRLDLDPYVTQEEEDMLFPQQSDTAPLPIFSRSSSSASSMTSLKRPAPSLATLESSCQSNVDIAQKYLIPSAHRLMEATVRMLVTGKAVDCRKPLHSFKVSMPHSATPFARLLPSMFNPGFSEAVASNAYFLPTISHAISVSWPQYTQSPVLKSKLAELAIIVLINEEALNTPTIVAIRLSKVVQSRLWSMMQIHLYDHSATKTLKWKKTKSSTPENGWNGVQDPHVLNCHNSEEGSKVGAHANDLEFREQVEEDYTSEFEDLLGDADGEKLDYWEEQRIETERHTDEMLFLDDDDNFEEDDFSIIQAIISIDNTHHNEHMLI